VTKGKDGYYRIRWSEMLYAAVNAVKTLNSKIEALASRIATDKERVATLKRDNAQMYAQLDKLADELEALEAKKK
jgi:outer membrane murein-binding lipoprotein Lpp